MRGSEERAGMAERSVLLAHLRVPFNKMLQRANAKFRISDLSAPRKYQTSGRGSSQETSASDHLLPSLLPPATATVLPALAPERAPGPVTAHPHADPVTYPIFRRPAGFATGTGSPELFRLCPAAWLCPAARRSIGIFADNPPPEDDRPWDDQMIPDPGTGSGKSSVPS